MNKQFFSCFCFLILLVSALATVPPKGFYFVMRNDFVNQVGESFSIQIADTANTYTSMPDVQGSTSQVSYTLSNFRFDLDLDGFYYQPNSPSDVIGWSQFVFVFVFNYHICVNAWPHPCESGWIQVTTTNVVKLQANLNLDFSGSYVQMSANSVQLLFNSGDISIFVQCTNTICIIPPSDIANAVAGQFVTQFQNGIQTSINTAANTYINGKYPTTIPIPSMHLDLVMDGTYNLMGPNVVFYLDGRFAPDSGPSILPPFSPTNSPPDSLFTNPPSQLNFVFTDYFVNSLIWALSKNGDFDITITNKDLPPSAGQFDLNTNNPLFLAAAPGLANYPNLNMTIELSLASSTVDLNNPTSIVIIMDANFNILTNPVKLAFTLTLQLSFDATTAAPVIINNNIVLNNTLSNWKLDVTGSKSYIGTINSNYFEYALQIVLPYLIPKQVPGIEIPLPTNFVVGSPTYQTGNGYASMGVAVTYTNPPETVCGPRLCPIGNTCCNWGGNYGCCPLPGASCCSGGGCCPSGTSCTGNGYCQ